MLSKIDDINKALDEITTTSEKYPQLMNERMDAAEFNAACNTIEEELNSLYEKIRLVEEIDEFCREYTIKKIQEKETQLKEKLKIIEDMADIYQSRSSVAEVVSFASTNEEVRDRDGSVISKMNLSSGKLEAQSDQALETSFSSITYTSNCSCYNNSYENLINGKPGISYYSVPEVYPEGIKERVIVTLAHKASCNHLDIKPVNCTLSNICILDDEKRSIYIDEPGYFPATNVVGFSFDITAKNWVRENKRGSKDCYDNSKAFGMLDTAYIRYSNEQLVKNMEKALAETDREYNIASLDSKCSTWENINKDIQRRNIVLAGEK